jgi:hypothetical protein
MSVSQQKQQKQSIQLLASSPKLALYSAFRATQPTSVRVNLAPGTLAGKVSALDRHHTLSN